MPVTPSSTLTPSPRKLMKLAIALVLLLDTAAGFGQMAGNPVPCEFVMNNYNTAGEIPIGTFGTWQECIDKVREECPTATIANMPPNGRGSCWCQFGTDFREDVSTGWANWPLHCEYDGSGSGGQISGSESGVDNPVPDFGRTADLGCCHDGCGDICCEPAEYCDSEAGYGGFHGTCYGCSSKEGCCDYYMNAAKLPWEGNGGMEDWESVHERGE